jgi:hypothetical protein
MNQSDIERRIIKLSKQQRSGKIVAYACVFAACETIASSSVMIFFPYPFGWRIFLHRNWWYSFFNGKSIHAYLSNFNE